MLMFLWIMGGVFFFLVAKAKARIIIAAMNSARIANDGNSGIVAVGDTAGVGVAVGVAVGFAVGAAVGVAAGVGTGVIAGVGTAVEVGVGSVLRAVMTETVFDPELTTNTSLMPES